MAPVLPEWIWCLTARVRDGNRIGEDHRLVHGTRHFAPGTKVYLYLPNWDERVATIGVPRYFDRFADVEVGRGSWDDSNESKPEIEDCIEWLSALDPNGKRWS